MRKGGLFAILVVCCAVVWLFWPPVLREPADRPIGAVSGPGVVVLGTSLSHGDWPLLMGRALESCGIIPGDIHQITKPGAHSGWGLTQLEAVIERRPALVLIEFAINDADIRDGVSQAESRKNHEEVIARLSAALPETRLAFMTMSPVAGLKRLTRPFLGRSYQMVADVAEAADRGLIDLYPRWQKAIAEGTSLPDGLHPAKDDVRRIALPAIVSAVAEAYGVPCDM